MIHVNPRLRHRSRDHQPDPGGKSETAAPGFSVLKTILALQPVERIANGREGMRQIMGQKIAKISRRKMGRGYYEPTRAQALPFAGIHEAQRTESAAQIILDGRSAGLRHMGEKDRPVAHLHERHLRSSDSDFDALPG